MAVQLADAVWMTVSSPPGTGTVTLGSRVTGYFGASNLVDGTQYYYTLQDCDSNGKPNGGTEIGYGTYTASGTTFSRDHVYTSITSGGTVSTSKINFSSGTQRLLLSCPAEFLNSVAPGGTTFDPATISWAAWFKADAITPQSDNTALTTWPDSGTGANSMTGGTAKPTYRTAASAAGINGLPCVQFAAGSSQYMSSSAGGAGLTGNFYIAAVATFPSYGSFQNVLSFGDNANHKRRSMALNPGSTNALFSLAFIGQFSDINPNDLPFVNSTQPYLIEMQYDGTNVTAWLNGVQVFSTTPSNPLQAPSSAALLLGENPGGSEFGNMSLSEVFFYGGNLSANTQNSVRLYLATKYQFFISNTTGLYIPEITQTGTQQASPATDVADYIVSKGGLIVGGQTVQYTGGGPSSVPYLNIATATVNGIFTAVDTRTTTEHMLVTNGFSFNVLAIWNRNTGGFSAARFLRAGGLEGGAVGVDSGGTGVVTQGTDNYGSMYIEASNFENTAHAGTFMIVQTGAIGGGSNGQYMRHEWRTNGNAYWYGLSVGSTSPPVNLVLTAGGTLEGQAIATNATKGHWKFPTCAGTPTGTPEGGEGSWVVDSTNHLVYCYLNGAWVNIA